MTTKLLIIGGVAGGATAAARARRLNEKKRYFPYCAIGLRGYLGHRILVQNGFKSGNLSGGYKTYLGAREKIMKESPQTQLWMSE